MNIDVSKGPVDGTLRDGTPARALCIGKNNINPLVVEYDDGAEYWDVSLRLPDGTHRNNRNLDFIPAPKKHVVTCWAALQIVAGHKDVSVERTAHNARYYHPNAISVKEIEIEFTEGEGLE